MEGRAVRHNFERDPQGIIPARFGLIWFSGFRGEDLNVKVYEVRRTPSDGKSSHGLWPGELKIYTRNCKKKKFSKSFFPIIKFQIRTTIK